MDLILWRHADAEEGLPDMGRSLTAKGHKQAAVMADWLRPRLPEQLRILVSPATRARQTADALHLDYQVADSISPGAGPDQLAKAAGWPDGAGAVLLVGHQPDLGELASLLLCRQATAMSVKKGAVIWLASRVRDEVAQTTLKALITPELINGHG